ncbi:CDP-alcohol phosphatidyltransferase family protein [Bifidobacterium pullorum]|uniref:CDP-alcohol phosphatidyltransferase family protein n=1 Tax=Bifidobacterium pullorum TaxID=78448 RepID=UPI003F276547
MERFRSGWKRIIEPIARLCVRLGISANAVTVVGSVLSILVTLLTGVTGWLFWGAFVLTILVLFDSLDGSVAALSGGGTRFGAFLDSTLDRIADWATLAGIILYVNLHSDLWYDTSPMNPDSAPDLMTPYITGVTLYAIMTSFVTSYARARAESVGCEAKNGVATRADRLTIILIGMALTGLTGQIAILAVAMTLLAVLGTITVVQRILEVRRQMSRAGE